MRLTPAQCNSSPRLQEAKEFLQHTHKNQRRSNKFPAWKWFQSNSCVCGWSGGLGTWGWLTNKIKLLIYRWHERQEQKEQGDQNPNQKHNQNQLHDPCPRSCSIFWLVGGNWKLTWLTIACVDNERQILLTEKKLLNL